MLFLLLIGPKTFLLSWAGNRGIQPSHLCRMPILTPRYPIVRVLASLLRASMTSDDSEKYPLLNWG